MRATSEVRALVLLLRTVCNRSQSRSVVIAARASLKNMFLWLPRYWNEAGILTYGRIWYDTVTSLRSRRSEGVVVVVGGRCKACALDRVVDR